VVTQHTSIFYKVAGSRLPASLVVSGHHHHNSSYLFSRFENVQYMEVSVMELERSRNKLEVIILACLEKPDFA
jgi:hypothetical protein